MASISSPGLGSGLDINGLVTKLVTAEKTPQVQLLNNRGAKLQAQVSAYGALKSALATFGDSLKGLRDPATFSAFSTSSSDKDAVTATGGSAGSKGSYSVSVSHLATAAQLASAPSASDTAVIGTGTLSFSFGTYDSGANSFGPNASKPTATVTIDAAHNSLRGIRDAVNQANIGVTASIVTDASGARLVFKSKDTGAANSIKLTVSDGDGTNTNASGLSSLAYDPTAAAGAGKNMTESTAATDATLNVDGLSIKSASNTVTGVIDGVTLSLKKETSGTPITVTVGQDTGAISKAISSLVSSYNSLVGTFKSVAGYDEATKTGGPLQGNSAIIGLRNGLGRMLSAAMNQAGDFNGLADIGLNLQKDGTLKLDSTKLNDAISSDAADVARLFAAIGTPSDPLVSFAGSTANTKAGTYNLDVTQLATQATKVATANSTLTVDGNNNTFSIKVDGVQSTTVTLTQQTYTSGAALAAEMQTRINGDKSLLAAGKTVNVAYVNDHLEISSANYGHHSTVQFTSVAANGSTLGLATGSEVTGLDAAGTLGSQAATGDGRYLTGTGSADGLQVKINGGATGARGTVTFGRGLADQLFGFLDQYTGTKSPLDAATKGLNASLDELKKQSDALNTRMAALEKRYRAQFNALDSLLGQLQNTSTQLTTQLANLPGLTG